MRPFEVGVVNDQQARAAVRSHLTEGDLVPFHGGPMMQQTEQIRSVEARLAKLEAGNRGRRYCGVVRRAH
jgi:hypothetical protein